MWYVPHIHFGLPISDFGVLFSISLIAVPYSIDENVERSTFRSATQNEEPAADAGGSVICRCGTCHLFQSVIQNHKSKIEMWYVPHILN